MSKELVLHIVARPNWDCDAVIHDGKGGWMINPKGVIVDEYESFVGKRCVDNYCFSGLNDVFSCMDGNVAVSEFNIIVSDIEPIDDGEYLTIQRSDPPPDDMQLFIWAVKTYEFIGCARKQTPWYASTDDLLMRKFPKADRLYFWAEDVPS